jgi:hypothetical protein
MSGKISQCMANLVALCSADAFFSDLTDPHNPVPIVPIVSRLVPDIDTKVDEALQNLGVGLVVTLRRIKFPEPEYPSITVQLVFALSAVSNQIINETGKNAYDVIERAWQLVHYKENGVSTSESPGGRFLVDADAVRPVPPPPKQPFIFFQLLTVNTEIDLS